MRLSGWWSAISVTVLLAGCATPMPQSEALVLKERAGRFSVQTQTSGESPEAVQGSFIWRRLPQGWQLDLKSPLGATLARLTVEPSGATLAQPDEPIRRAGSGDELLASVLGASVPLEVLEDWVDGRVVDAGEVSNVSRDEQGRIISFQQSGWQVDFDRYGSSSPQRVTARGQQYGRSVMVRLVADESF